MRCKIEGIVAVAIILISLICGGCGGGGNDGGGIGGSQPPEDEDPLNVIISLTAEPISPGTIVLSWDPVGSNRLYWVFMDGCLKTQLNQFEPESPVTAQIDRLIPETEYCFRVVAYTFSPYFYIGESIEVCTVTPPDNTLPSTPDYLRAESNQTQEISLMWEEATDNAWVAGYKIYRDGVYLQEVSEVSFTDTTLDPNTLYCYQITAIDAAGNESPKSIKACASISTPSKIMNLEYTPGSVGFVGRTSLVLDSTNNAHISYYDEINKLLYYATNEDGTWSISTIDSGVYGFTSIVVDALNKVHISYTSGGVYSLKYATNASGTWVITTVDSSWVGLFSSLAIDSFGKAYISYYDYGNGYLKYATNSSGLWETSTIDTGLVGKYTSIALDSTGKAHISYYDVQNEDLRYATNATDVWEISTLDSTGDVGQHTSLAIDSEDKVHISYYDATNLYLKYATNAAGTWVTSVIDTGGMLGTGWQTSLTLDDAGYIHISYNDVGHNNLKYATKASGAWKIYLIAPEMSGLSSIKLDAIGMAHLSSHQSTNIIYSIYSIY